jgi:hypothetical protein
MNDFNAIWVAGFAMLASIASPWVASMSRRKERDDLAEENRRIKEEDWQRQDEVARRADVAREALAEASRQLLQRQDAAAEEARQVAAKLAETSKLAAVEAKQVSTKLDESTKRVETQARIQAAKLDQIHSLVNSNLTASMQSQLDALKLLLVSLETNRDLKAAHRETFPQSSTDAIEETKTKIADLSEQVKTRIQQTQQAAKNLEQAIDKA